MGYKFVIKYLFLFLIFFVINVNCGSLYFGFGKFERDDKEVYAEFKYQKEVSQCVVNIDNDKAIHMESCFVKVEFNGCKVSSFLDGKSFFFSDCSMYEGSKPSTSKKSINEKRIVAHDGINGKDGKDGRNGKDGKNGAQGKQGERGSDGLNGQKGEMGSVGQKGERGLDGLNGQKGEMGSVGQKGERGMDGRDGIQGKQGERGLDGLNGQKGEIGTDGQKGEQGERGLDGLKGDEGINGKDGQKGDQGERGLDGQKGDAGSDGKDGLNGERGEVGQKGDQGERGLNGEAGKDGRDGKDGKDGERGIQGEKGEKSEKGDKGESGESIVGQKGEEGAKGDRGENGVAGRDGVDGKDGLNGEKGERGDFVKGDQGEKGDRGTDGVAGQKGEVGAEGQKGQDGERGQDGTKGEVGTMGAMGDKGEQGVIGNKGDKGDKGDKGEVTVIKMTVVVEKNKDALAEVSRTRQPYFLLPKSAVQNKDFSFYQPYMEDATYNLYSSVYLNHSSQIYPPNSNLNFLSVKENIFNATCEKDSYLVGGDCQWSIFNFKSSPIQCNSKDFSIDNKCKRKLKSKNCFSSLTSITSIEDPEVKLVESFTVLNYRGAKQKINNPKCRMFELAPLTSEDQTKCGYFCFFHQLDHVYVKDDLFSCKYVAPDFQHFNKEMKLLTGVNSQSISFWEQTIQVITVEAYCAKKFKKTETKSDEVKREYTGNEEKDKVIEEKFDLSKTRSELEELRQQLELQKQELEESNTNNEKLSSLFEKEKEDNDLLKKEIESQKESQLKDENLIFFQLNQQKEAFNKEKKREDSIKKQFVRQIKKDNNEIRELKEQVQIILEKMNQK